MKKQNVNSIKGIILFAAVVVLAVVNIEKILYSIAFLFSIIKPFVVGACLAFVLNIPVTAIENKFFKKNNKISKHKRVISFLETLLVLTLITLGVYSLVIPQLELTLKDLGGKIPKFFVGMWKSIEELTLKYPEILQYVETLDMSEFNWDYIISGTTNFLKNGMGSVLTSTVVVAGSVFKTLVDSIIAVVFAIYILMQKDQLVVQARRLLKAVLPETYYKNGAHIFRLLNRNFKNFITYQCIEAIILGMMYLISMTIFGFQYAVMISVLITITAIIPVVGAFIGCGVGAFLILVDDPERAIWFVILFQIIQQIEGNLIYPKVVGSSVGLPPIWVLVAVTLGGSLMGVVGMLLFIPIASTLYALIKEYVEKKENIKYERERIISEQIELEKK